MATLTTKSVKLFNLARNGSANWKMLGSLEQKRFQSGGMSYFKLNSKGLERNFDFETGRRTTYCKHLNSSRKY